MDAIQLADIGQRLANLSAFQRVLLDYIKKHIDGLSQGAIAASVSRGGSELFYQLEQLRLLGLIIAEKEGPHDSGAPTFTYRLRLLLRNCLSGTCEIQASLHEQPQPQR
jgi:hypothetical protein